MSQSDSKGATLATTGDNESQLTRINQNQAQRIKMNPKEPQ